MARILIAGGTGLIGTLLSKKLKQGGHEVFLLSRNPKKIKEYTSFFWDPVNLKIDEACLNGVDHVINLSGAGIADKRWTASRKKKIIESRTRGAKLFADLFSKGHKPKSYIASSAIGYYGDQGDNWLVEESPAGKGFLSESVMAWENASSLIAETDVFVQIIRIGIVLSSRGGALKKMLPGFSFKLGNYFGTGSQYYSWIHIEDLVGIFEFLVTDPPSSGIFNAVSSEPISNNEFAKQINAAGNYKAILLGVPKFALELALGELSHVVLDSTRVNNQKIKSLGYQFKWPEIKPALKDLLENGKY